MRRWLAALVAATTSLVLIALLVPLALLVNVVAEGRALGEAEVTADTVAVAASTGDVQTIELTAQRSATAGGLPVTVFLQDGRVIGSPAVRSDAVRLAQYGRSVTAEAPGGREVLVAVAGTDLGTVVVRVFVDDDELSRGVGATWLAMLLVGLVLIGVGIAVADRLALAVTRPVGRLAGISHRLAAGDLSARAEPEGPPEVRAVAHALNGLAGRIHELLTEERETVADVSHRLRTPLTGLRLEAESLSDPADAARIGARVDDLERAVTSVITEARQRSEGRGSSDAAKVVAERVAFWSVLAEDQSRAVDLDLADGPLPVGIGATELAALVDALLGNVFAHTPEGAGFWVRLLPTQRGARLVVADTGPGFTSTGPLIRGKSGGGSTGLGLDIARRTAESSGGGLRLGEAPGGGAMVIVDLSRP